MIANTRCTECGRTEDGCICGSDRRHFTCAVCLQDVNRYEACWFASAELPESVPAHDACTGAALQRFPDMKFAPAPDLSPAVTSRPVTEEKDAEELVSFIFNAPIIVHVEGTTESIAQRTQSRLIQVFDALRTGAERASFVFDSESQEVRIKGFSEIVDALLKPMGEKPN